MLAGLLDEAVATTWRADWPVDLRTTLGPLSRGRGDPTFRFVGDVLWRTTLTPDGPATMCLRARGRVVDVAAWGSGAEWAISSVPDLVGVRDDPSGFAPEHPLLRSVLRRHPGLRIGRTNRVFEVLVPTVLEQKVTTIEARRAWRYLMGRYGELAPGPAPAGMRVAPGPSTWARIPSWEWHRAGVDAKRSATIIRAASVAGRLEDVVELAPAAALSRLRTIPGIGPWTAAEIAQRSLGDADAVTIGDLHLPGLVGWALAGRPYDDAAMLDALAPYAPHRHRATRLVELAGVGKPRFAPRYSIRDFRWM